MDKIKLVSCYFCEQVIVDQKNRLSLINLFTGINAKDFPTLHPLFFVNTHVKGPEGEHPEKVEVIGEDGATITEVNGKANIRSKDGSHFYAKFANTPFKKPGKYWVRVTVGDTIVTTPEDHSFSVTQIV